MANNVRHVSFIDNTQLENAEIKVWPFNKHI